MKWTQRARTDVRGVIDKFQIYGKVLAESRQKIRGAGAPCTYYENKSISYYGTAPKDATRCYCWGEQTSSPDRSHFLCLGTGYLEGYQKYGYSETVLATPSGFFFKDTSIIKSGSRSEGYAMSSSSATSGELIFNKIELSHFYEVDRFYVTHLADLNQNNLEYYFTINDVEWHRIPLSTLKNNPLADFAGDLTVFSNIITPDMTYVRFKIVFRKRYNTSTSAMFNSIRFRYRNQLNLSDTDQRYAHITYPAFLAAREQQTIEITQGEQGWTTVRPLRWWVLPEVNIKNEDLISFVDGSLSGQYYVVRNLTPHMHGPELQVLHKAFESSYIRDSHDIIKILHMLS